MVFLALFGLFFKFFSQGIYMRSVADNQRAALSLGCMSSGYSPCPGPSLPRCRDERYRPRGHQRGQCSRLKCHRPEGFVVILGGLDSIGGAIIGGIIIGLLESLTGGYISPSLRDVIPYIVLVVILMIKPYGLSVRWK